MALHDTLQDLRTRGGEKAFASPELFRQGLAESLPPHAMQPDDADLVALAVGADAYTLLLAAAGARGDIQAALQDNALVLASVARRLATDTWRVSAAIAYAAGVISADEATAPAPQSLLNRAATENAALRRCWDRPAPEQVVLDVDGIYRWDGRKMGATILRAPLGRLVLTSQRLLFLTAGGNDAASRMMRGAAGRVVLPSGSGVGMEALEHPESRDFHLRDLTAYDFTSKRFKSWLTVTGADSAGASYTHSFSTQTHLPGQAAWKEEMQRARAALGLST